MQQFIQQLEQAGLELGYEDIADAVWLATHIGTDSDVDDLASADTSDTNITETKEYAGATILRGLAWVGQDELQSTVASSGVSAYPSDAVSQTFPKEGIPFQSPGVAALQNSLSLGRALRPLMKKLPSNTHFQVDSDATVNRIVEQNIWHPVVKPAPERWLDLEVIIEESPLTFIWQQAIDEFRRKVLERQGAFRKVRAWSLQEQNGQPLLISRQLGGTGERIGHPRELVHPSGRRLIMLITDCRSVLWQSPPTQTSQHSTDSLSKNLYDWLNYWTTQGPLVLTQLLPEWLWERSVLAQGFDVELGAVLPGVANTQLTPYGLSSRQRRRVNVDAVLKVPVVTLETDALAVWSKVVAGHGTAKTPGVVWDVAKIRAIQQAGAIVDEFPISDEALVDRFLATASPKAQQLAGMMALVPVSLSVIHLLQAELLKDSTPVHVSEVFMSGLLTQVGVNQDNQRLIYDFKNQNIRHLLAEALPTYTAQQVINLLSKAIGRKFGQTNTTFAAFLSPDPEWIEQGQDGDRIVTRFAELMPETLRSMGGIYAILAESSVFSNDTKVSLEQDIQASQKRPEDIALIKIFCAYAAEDKILQAKLRHCLQPLSHQRLSYTWNESKVTSDSNWGKELNLNMESADIMLLLISADFLASDFCWKLLQKSIALHITNQTITIPILLRPVDLKGSAFKNFKILPKGEKPITTWNNQDEVFSDITKGIRLVSNIILENRDKSNNSYLIIQDISNSIRDTSKELSRLKEELRELVKEQDEIETRLSNQGLRNEEFSSLSPKALAIGQRMIQKKSEIEVLGRRLDNFEQEHEFREKIFARKLYLNKLQGYLEQGNWQEADQETTKIILEFTGRENSNLLFDKYIKDFNFSIFQYIDDLWLKASNKKFGFSTQVKIWRDVGGKSGTFQAFVRFGDRVGWRTDGEWVGYDNFIFNSSAPEGHLPSLILLGEESVSLVTRRRLLKSFMKLTESRLRS